MTDLQRLAEKIVKSEYFYNHEHDKYQNALKEAECLLDEAMLQAEQKGWELGTKQGYSRVQAAYTRAAEVVRSFTGTNQIRISIIAAAIEKLREGKP